MKQIIYALGLFTLLQSAQAQWTNQTFELKAGWNAIHLAVDPMPAKCDDIFANFSAPVETVRTFHIPTSTATFSRNPNPQLQANETVWLNWQPASSAVRFDQDLHTLRFDRAYLIKLPDNVVGTHTLQVAGRAVYKPQRWRAQRYNMVGFRFNPGNEPDFDAFFEPSNTLSNQKIYQLNASTGSWDELTAAAKPSTNMKSGEAFWMNSFNTLDYQGPTELTMQQTGGLDYGATLAEQDITLKNLSDAARTVTLRSVPSEPAPPGVTPVNAGPVPLAYWFVDVDTGTFEWRDLPGTYQFTLPPGGTRVLRLAVERGVLPEGHTYQSLLEISDDVGTYKLLPVTAEGKRMSFGGSSLTGLWVGHARLGAVNDLGDTGNPATTPTSSEFSFRLILHVDSNNVTRLLPWVIQMFDEGEYSVPDNEGLRTIEQPGRFVWLTDPDLVDNGTFSGATLRDGKAVGRRISSMAFNIDQPQDMQPGGNFGTSTVTFTVHMPKDHPRNPYRHKYHPDHAEGFEYTRSITLDFTQEMAEVFTLSGKGDQYVTGVYQEAITGMHKETLHTTGSFHLSRISRAGALNE